MSSYTFTMYRESMHRQTGLGIGDDALPYAGAHLISVADGLGGSAYPAPVDVNPELLNQETSFSAMLGGILDTESESSGTYRRQYEDNFFTDRFDLAKDYVRAGGRKSSYFGSRLTNLLMRRHLEEMFAGEQLDSYFEEMRSATPAQREQRNQQLGETLAEMLGNELRQAADNLDKINEASCNTYLVKAKDKLTREKLNQLLDAETFFTAEEALAYGLCDEVIDPVESDDSEEVIRQAVENKNPVAKKAVERLRQSKRTSGFKPQEPSEPKQQDSFEWLENYIKENKIF